MDCKPKYDIFISYRRATGANAARMMQLALTARGYSVFLDYDSLEDGKFNEAIYSAIDSCEVFILMMTEGVLDRCEEEGDWVRLEIQRAIEKRRHIVPVGPSDHAWEMPTDLPETLSGLRDIQVSKLDMESLFNESVVKIETGRFPRELRNRRRSGGGVAPGVQESRSRLWIKVLRVLVISCLAFVLICMVRLFIVRTIAERTSSRAQVSQVNQCSLRRIENENERAVVRAYLKSLYGMLDYAAKMQARYSVVLSGIKALAADSPGAAESGALLSVGAHSVIEKFLETAVEDCPSFGDELEAFCALVENPAERMGPMGIQNFIANSKTAWDLNLVQLEKALGESSKLSEAEKIALVKALISALDACSTGFCIWTMRALVAFDQRDDEFVSFRCKLASLDAVLPFSKMPFYEDAAHCESAWAAGLAKTNAIFMRINRLFAKANVQQGMKASGGGNPMPK